MNGAQSIARAPAADAARIAQAADQAAEFLKALSHDGRLKILCHIAYEEKSVSELEALLDSRQAAVSQQLARLREAGLVAFRREGKSIRYRLADPRVERILQTLHDLFCAAEDGAALVKAGAAQG